MSNATTSDIRRFVLVVAAAIASSALVVPAPAALAAGGIAKDASATAWTPPPYKTLRQDEDWSGLAGVDRSRLDLRDAIKYLPLRDDGFVWLSLGGQLRERVEAWEGFNFGAPVGADDDDVFLVSRLRLHADLHVGEYLRMFVEGKSSLATDRDLAGGRRTLEVDEADFQNAFLEVSVPISDRSRAVVRGGRQELLFGKQRLVSPLDWSNTRRTFDGFTAALEVPGWKVTGFWTRPVMIEKYDLNDAVSTSEFGGAYATRPTTGSEPSIDLYWLRLLNDSASFNGTSGAETRDTLGVRAWGAFAGTPADYEVETAYQFGSVGDGNIKAYMVASQVGWKLTCEWKPRVFVGFDYASGDKSPGGDVETFNQLFPLGHAYMGYIDTVARQNIVDVSVGGAASPAEDWHLSLTGHSFSRANRDDALYNAGGGVVRAGAAGTSKDVGTEIDVVLSYDFDRHLNVSFGYSHFFPGTFIDQSGPSEDIDFVYMPVQYTF